MNQKRNSIMSNNRRQDFIRTQIRKLVEEGLVQMRRPDLTDEYSSIWIEYSRQVLEIITREYNPDILLNYMKVIMSIQPQLRPYQKIGICLDYLIGVLRII